MIRLRRKVKKRLSILIFFIIILVGSISTFYIYNKKDLIEKQIYNKPENPFKIYKANLIATGDALIHSPLYDAARVHGKDSNTYDFTPMLVYTKEKLKDYDIKYYNQETVFDNKSALKTYPIFNTPNELGKNMIETGFNMVSLATNHSMDMGASGAKNSVNWWKKQKDILTHGMASSEEMRNEYDIKTIKGITYTMLSYTYGTNGLGAYAIQQEPYLVNLIDEDTILKDIKAVRDKVDVLIVAMHWGNEYQQYASEYQKQYAKFLANNGVDIVIGNHSHSIQPWERINNTVVFYSLGNFISNQMGANEALIRKVGVVGVFVTLDITKKVNTITNTKTITIDNIGADLNYTLRFYNKEINRNDYLVIPFSKMEEKYLKNYESVYNEFSQVLKKYDKNINIEPLPNKKVVE